MTTDTTINIADRAADFRKMMAGSLPDEVIKNAAKGIEATATSYAANGSIASVIFWMKCQCIINGGKTFNGQSWGISFPGGGALIGDVYLTGNNTLQTLYANTTGFALTATPVYTAFYFLDKSANTLGHFQAGSVSTVAGTGGGDGSWS